MHFSKASALVQYSIHIWLQDERMKICSLDLHQRLKSGLIRMRRLPIPWKPLALPQTLARTKEQKRAMTSNMDCISQAQVKCGHVQAINHGNQLKKTSLLKVL